MSDRRLLLVHAHPDDETITTGATIAHYAALGVEVTLLTCTLGEQGEILVPSLAGLDAGAADQLGGYRIGEFAAACDALGVGDHRFLGGAGRFRDSGMMGSPANEHSRAFWRAAGDPAVFDLAVGLAVEVIDEVRPHVVITYDPDGDYGHPDHIMAHRVTTAAVERAAWQVSKLYWTATPRSVLDADRAAVTADPTAPFGALPTAPEGGSAGVPDDVVTTVLDASRSLAAKTAALRAHATQVSVAQPYWTLSNGFGRRLSGVEHFRLVGSPAVRETDLFDGPGP